MNTILTESIGKTLSYAWTGAFSWLELWSKKQTYKSNLDYFSYKQSLESHIKEIPQEELKEPRLSLVGPAIEASRYYIEEPIIREMFAKLIASDLDKRKTGQVHHSYVEIIKQMSPIDAYILLDFHNPSNLVQFRVRSPIPDKDFIYSDIYLSDRFTEFSKEICISISNLSRLGLIDSPTRFLPVVDENNENAIQRFKHTALYRGYVNNNDLSQFQIRSYPAHITELGFNFRQICLN